MLFLCEVTPLTTLHLHTLVYISTLPPGEGGIALVAAVFLVSSVQLDMTISAALVFKQSAAELASERHVLAVSLKHKLVRKQLSNHLNTELVYSCVNKTLRKCSSFKV